MKYLSECLYIWLYCYVSATCKIMQSLIITECDSIGFPVIIINAFDSTSTTTPWIIIVNDMS